MHRDNTVKRKNDLQFEKELKEQIEYFTFRHTTVFLISQQLLNVNIYLININT